MSRLMIVVLCGYVSGKRDFCQILQKRPDELCADRQPATGAPNRSGRGREMQHACDKRPRVLRGIRNIDAVQRGRSAAGSLAVAAYRRFSMSTDRVADDAHHQLLGSTTTTISGAS
jgi:hypothetical protein